MSEPAKKYYRQTYTVVVLTEDPTEASLDQLPESVNGGDDCLQSFEMTSMEELTGKQAADALYASGSEPGFFQLDDEGNPL